MRYGDYIRDKKIAEHDDFFGEGHWQEKNSQLINYDSILDDNNIILRTYDVYKMKDSYVLVIGKHNAVYLKDYCIKKFNNQHQMIDGYLVKLSRKYFKPYTFKYEFPFFGKEVNSFDELLEEAERQNHSMYIRMGSL